MTDNRPFTAADRAAQAKRTAILADLDRMTRDREAKRNRAAFGPARDSLGMTSAQLLEYLQPGALAQEAAGMRRMDELEELIEAPTDPVLDEIMERIEKDGK